jgi:hypothetical protein
LNANTLRTILAVLAAITAFFARLGGRFGVAGFLAGGVLALPAAFVLGLLGCALAVFLLQGVLLLLAALLGTFLTTLLVLALIGYGGYRIYGFVANIIKLAHLETYLPFLNEYKNLPARYNPALLSQPLRGDLEYLSDLLTDTLLRYTRPDTLHALQLSEASESRHLLARLTFEPLHFSHLSLSEIRAHFPQPVDLDALEARLAREVSRTLTRTGATILGEQCASSPPLFHRQDEQIIAVSQADRFKHTYIIGKTGSGKTNLLKHLITQDLRQPDRGVIVLSPEDGIFHALLAAMPESHHDDLLYFDPTDTTAPRIGFNCFDFRAGDTLPPAERDAYLTQCAGETYTIFERALGDLGVKMTTLMQNVCYALLQLPHATILDIDRLLDPRTHTLRQQLLRAPDVDERTKRFWHQYADSHYYTSAYEPVINRLEPFFRPPLSTILSTPSFSFHDILNASRPRIIFLNLSKLRGVPATILGQLCIATIQQTLQRREQIPEAQRTPYFFYIDEFSLFTTSEDSFIHLFERARKYRMGVTLAHQVTADLSTKLLDTLTGNVATMLVMQLGASDAPYFARALQLIAHDERKQRRVTEQEGAKLDREALRIARETGTVPDLLADPNDVLLLQQHIRASSEGTVAPSILQNLPTGGAVAKIPTYHYGIPLTIPYVPDADDFRAADLRPTLIARSKANFGTTEHAPPPEHTATDQADHAPPPPQTKKSFAITFE